MTELPTVSHEGVLKMGGMSIRCFRLSDGQTVFDATDFEAFIEAWFGGKIDMSAEDMKRAAAFVVTGEME